MNHFIKMLTFAFSFSLLTSCGADKLKTKIGANQSSLTKGCLFTSDNMPVCDVTSTPPIDYINASHASCYGAINITPGHCDCASNPNMVCGSDGKDYSECDAKNLGVQIVKYLPCAAAPL